MRNRMVSLLVALVASCGSLSPAFAQAPRAKLDTVRIQAQYGQGFTGGAGTEMKKLVALIDSVKARASFTAGDVTRIRAQVIAARGKIRASETQASKTLSHVDELLAILVVTRVEITSDLPRCSPALFQIACSFTVDSIPR